MSVNLALPVTVVFSFLVPLPSYAPTPFAPWEIDYLSRLFMWWLCVFVLSLYPCKPVRLNIYIYTCSCVSDAAVSILNRKTNKRAMVRDAFPVVIQSALVAVGA